MPFKRVKLEDLAGITIEKFLGEVDDHCYEASFLLSDGTTLHLSSTHPISALIETN